MIDKQRHWVVNGKTRHLQGVRPSRANRPRRALLAAPAAPLPPRSNDNAGKLQLHVEDQETIGCCTGEGVTSAMEAAILIASGIRVQLSALFLYYWSRLFEGTPSWEDSGCAIPDVVEVACERGVCLNASWPFDAEKFSEQPPVELAAEAALHTGLLDFECVDDAATKHSLIQGFPVVCGFDVPNAMMTDAVSISGLVAPPKDGNDVAGGHCVLIVDYDDDIEIHGVRGAWKCLNSWGNGWALGGYFWMAYGCLPSDRFTFRRVGAA